MPVLPTLAALLAALGFAVFCGWRGAALPDLARGRPRMVPWRFLMVLAAGVGLYLAIHLVNLLGVTTGR